MEKNGVAVEPLRPVDYDLAFGVYTDMTEPGVPIVYTLLNSS